MKSNTVFGHLVHQFAIHPENLATEALSYILRTSPAASRAFTKFVRQIVSDCPENMRFETQQVGLEQSVPDMKCFDDEGNIRVIVENKFWAGLTENQPVTYIRELPAGVGALVLLVIPAARLQIVWDEVVARCKGAEIPVSDVQKLTTKIAAGIGEGHYVAATPWSVLLDTLSVAATSSGEIESYRDIAQLVGLCRTMEEEAFLPLRSEELTNLDMARRFINFSNLPFGIVEEAVRLGLCSKKKESSFRYGSGTYIRIGEFTAWAGFSTNLWRRFGVSPIWVNFYPESRQTAEVRKRLLRFRVATPQRCFDADINHYRWIAVPIFLTSGVEKQRIIEDAVLQIRELRDELGVREPLVATSPPELTDDPSTNFLDHMANEDGSMTGETILEFGAGEEGGGNGEG